MTEQAMDLACRNFLRDNYQMVVRIKSEVGLLIRWKISENILNNVDIQELTDFCLQDDDNPGIICQTDDDLKDLGHLFRNLYEAELIMEDYHPQKVAPVTRKKEELCVEQDVMRNLLQPYFIAIRAMQQGTEELCRQSKNYAVESGGVSCPLRDVRRLQTRLHHLQNILMCYKDPDPVPAGTTETEPCMWAVWSQNGEANQQALMWALCRSFSAAKEFIGKLQEVDKNPLQKNRKAGTINYWIDSWSGTGAVLRGHTMSCYHTTLTIPRKAD